MKISAPFWIFDPQFSPDCHKVLFKVGYPFQEEIPFSFFAWDLDSNTILNGPKIGLQNRPLIWSPDSETVIYFKEGPTVEPSLDMYTFDFSKGEDKRVFQNVSPPATWLSPTEILFQLAADKPGDAPGQLWKIKRGEAKPTKTPLHGPAPLLSPDGKQVAIVSSELIGSKGRFRNSLLIVDLKTGKSKRVPTGTSGDIHFGWTSDSSALLLFRRTEPEASKLSLFDVETAKLRVVGEITGHNLSKAPMSPKFQLIERTTAAQTAYVIVTEFDEENPVSKFWEGHVVLKAVDLQKGTVTPLLRVNNTTGQDWRPQ